MGAEIGRALSDKLKNCPGIGWAEPSSPEKSKRKAPVFKKIYQKILFVIGIES